ncbi:MAG: hypothetical protein JRI97_08190 [Deltaproteobacteria bacterium]|nr:hypothetical protein [Deltaproteobacteria bacterium]
MMQSRTVHKLPAREFVKHRNGRGRPREVEILSTGPGPYPVTVVIPTLDADRGGYFGQLLKQIQGQTLKPLEIIVVKGDTRQGRAINIGAALSRGRMLATMDDDTRLLAKDALERLHDALAARPDVGMAGGVNAIPDDAPPLVKKAMAQIPRRSTPPVDKVTDSDLAEHPLLMMKKEAFFAVGGENEVLPRGLDPYLRREFRSAGWRVVVVPGAAYAHLPPESLSRLVSQFYRNGRQAAFVNRNYPRWVLETPAGHGTDFSARVPLPLRVPRYAWRMGRAALTGKWLLLLTQAAYALGFARGWVTPGGE